MKVVCLPRLLLLKPDEMSRLNDKLPRLLTVPDVVEQLRISRSKVYELIAMGKLRSVKIGRCVRIPEKSVLDLLANSGLHGVTR